MKSKIKIIIIIIIALLMTNISSKYIFLANTPRINTLFLSNLKDIPFNIIDNSNRLFASFFQRNGNIEKRNVVLNKFEKLPTASLNKLAGGVYAKEDKENNVLYMRLTDEIEWEERTVLMEGKQIKVRFPKGSFSQ